MNRCFAHQIDDHDLGQDYIKDILEDIAQGRISAPKILRPYVSWLMNTPG
ncbi:MAG: hypothetical protein HZA29_00985 [Candidatus Omnitrophica bacterium]|nr:hypothetical protein [Candidatus Omnitrophota bacterium]